MFIPIVHQNRRILVYQLTPTLTIVQAFYNLFLWQLKQGENVQALRK